MAVSGTPLRGVLSAVIFMQLFTRCMPTQQHHVALMINEMLQTLNQAPQDVQRQIVCHTPKFDVVQCCRGSLIAKRSAKSMLSLTAHKQDSRAAGTDSVALEELSTTLALAWPRQP
jgi:hypothetical protein